MKLGYYTLDDGSKSTDFKNKHLMQVKAKKGKEQEYQHPPPKKAMSAWTFFVSEKAVEFG